MREYLHLLSPADAFPFGVSRSRSLDLDHAIAYLDPNQGGPPGQTGPHSLAPLTRGHHRSRTHGRWRRRQPEPGLTVWRSPHGWHYLVNASGTHPLGTGAFAQGVWDAARPPETDQTPSGPAVDLHPTHIESVVKVILASPQHPRRFPLRR